MTSRSKVRRLLIVACMAGLGLAACGSSSKSTSPSTTASGTTGTTVAATGSTLTIGIIESVTGAPGAGSGRITAATDILQAWAKQTDATGGINGHAVKVIALNDNADPAQAQSDLATLQADNALAIVGEDASTTEPNWKATIDKYKLPVIGGTAYSANWFTDPLFYPATTTVVSNVWAQPYTVKTLQPTGPKIASLLCSNSSVCQGATSIISASSKQLGIPIVYNQTADANAVSYTPQCLAMKSSGATAIIPAGINYVSVIRDCKRQGYNPLVITTNYGPTPDAIHQNPSELAGLVGPSPVFPPFQEFPQNAGYFNLLKAYAPGYLPGGAQYNSGTNSGTTLNAAADAYVAALVFAQALKNANVPASGTVTRTDIITGLSMIKNDTFGGISPPLSYNDGTTPNPQIPCFYLFKTANTTAGYETIPPNTMKLYCQPPSALDGNAAVPAT